MINFFLEKMREFPAHEAVVSSEFSASYEQLLAQMDKFTTWLAEKNIPEGAVVSFDGDYSTSSIALFLALTKNKNIVVPLSQDSRRHFVEFREIASTEFDISLSGDEASLIYQIL